jgi:hypothetical protein
MTNDHLPQLDSSGRAERSPIELNYPLIPVSASFASLLAHSAAANMAVESQSNNQDTPLSESWATLSDADYSLDDDLRSETTDAASIVDNAGPDDVHSIDDHTSDASSQDAESDKITAEEFPPQRSVVESTTDLQSGTVGALKGSHPPRPLALKGMDSQAEPGFAEVTQVIHSLSHKEAEYLVGCTLNDHEHRQVVLSVCMTVSNDSLKLDRPFRLLYCGDTTARAKILAKIGEVLVAGLGSGQSCRPLDSSRYNVVPHSKVSDSPLNNPDIVPIRTQIIVDDCITAAQVEHEQAPDQIFLGFKNGSLYSSRWNGASYEVSPVSEWASPDLAIFFLARGDHSVWMERHQLAHDFVLRHEIPTLCISETTSWEPHFTDTRLDMRTPHFRIGLQDMQSSGVSPVVKRLPIDLETFECLDSDQLNKNFAHLGKRSEANAGLNVCRQASAPRQSSRGKSPTKRRTAAAQDSPKPSTLHFWYTDSPLMRTIIPAALGLMLPAIAFVACKLSMALFMYALSHPGDVSEPSQATTWSFQSPSIPSIPSNAPSVIKTAHEAVTTGNNVVSKSLTIMDAPSELAELITSKSLHATNKSEKFQVHSIGDCHIIVKMPRGFKVRRKTTSFNVVVARGEQVLDSSVSRLFDGVYTVQVNREDAYGLLNVTIRWYKSSFVEEHQVDFGAQWLKVAGWKKAAQIASEQVRNDLDTAQLALSAAYDQISEDMLFKAQDVSKKAARQAKKFSQQTRLFINSTAKALEASSNKLQQATNHERQEAYEALSRRADLAFQALMVYAHTANERGRSAIEKVLISAGQSALHIQRSTPHVDLADVQNKMQEYMRSERLAKAQERAKRMVQDSASSWRKRRALRRPKGSGCCKKGKACNR